MLGCLPALFRYTYVSTHSGGHGSIPLSMSVSTCAGTATNNMPHSLLPLWQGGITSNCPM